MWAEGWWVSGNSTVGEKAPTHGRQHVPRPGEDVPYLATFPNEELMVQAQKEENLYVRRERLRCFPFGWIEGRQDGW